jgi:hypothetical protein
MNSGECLTALVCQLVSCALKLSIREPPLGNTLAVDKPHKECLADGVAFIEYGVYLGYWYVGATGKPDNLSLVDQRQTQNVALKVSHGICREWATAQNERSFTPDKTPRFIVCAARKPLEGSDCRAADFVYQ